MPPELFFPEVVIVDGLYLMKPKPKPMRSFFAERVEQLDPPLGFHHYHDRGVCDLHEGRWRVFFGLNNLNQQWEVDIAQWLTDNIETPFEVEDYSNPAGNAFDPKYKPIRSALLTNEGDAKLLYLMFK